MKKRLISVILGISVLCSVLPSAAAEYGYYGGAELAAEITVTLNPTDRTVISGSKAYFEVAAAGGGTLSYQWYSSESSDGAGTAIEGADKNIYTVTASSENSGKYFYCVISNNTTKAESRRALLTTQYKISYDANGGVDAPISQYKLHDQNIAISIFKPEYFAHTFLGWSDRANASTAQYRPGDDISLNKNTILYAVWRSAKQQYNVTSFNDTVTTEVGGEKNYFMFSPSESGVYAFESSAPYGQDTYGEIYSSNGVLLADNDDCMLINDNTRNFRVYSNLVAGKVYYLSAEYYSATAVGSFGVALRKQYTLSYDSNGGGGADEPQNILTGENYSVSEEQPEREGFTFLGWSENKAAVEAAYKPGDKVSGGRDVTLYAVWENDSYKVTYNFSYNGGISVTESSKRVEPGGAVDLTPTAQKYGWDFVGWNTDPDETTGIKSLNATGNITLYAIYKKTIYADFIYSNNARQDHKEIVLYNNNVSNNVELPAPYPKSGWKSEGWRTDCTAAAPGLKEGEMESISGDTKFYAVYSKDITIEYPENTAEKQTVKQYYNAAGNYEQVQIPLPSSPESIGKSFNGWSLNGELFKEEDTAVVSGDTKIEAKWYTDTQQPMPVITISNADSEKIIKIECADTEAEIYYSINDSEYEKYISELSLSEPMEYEIKAYSMRKGYQSEVSIRRLRINTVDAPFAVPGAGMISGKTSVILSTTTPGAEIYYTLDGSEPDKGSLKYTGSITVDSSITIKAVAVLDDVYVSDVKSFEYNYVHKTDKFNVNADAYRYVNKGSSFGYAMPVTKDNYPIPYDPSYKVIFGDTILGKTTYVTRSKLGWGGNCCGLSSTAALFFSNANLSSEDFGADSVYGLDMDATNPGLQNLSVKSFIEAMQISQYTSTFSAEYGNNKYYKEYISNGKNLDNLYNEIQAAVLDKQCTIIAIGKDYVGGHALLGYDIEDTTSMEAVISIYDCNYPGEERHLTLKRDISGHFVDWSYDMGGSYGEWSSEIPASEPQCFISYIPYSTIEYIWEHRGGAKGDNQLLNVNAVNLSIANAAGDVVAYYRDGKFETERDDIYEIPMLSIGHEDSINLYMPRDGYKIISEDDKDLDVMIFDDKLSADVETNAKELSFNINNNTNDINISLSDNIAATYKIEFENINDGMKYNNVILSGSLDNELEVRNYKDSISLSSDEVDNIKINGEEKNTHIISATAGSGGTITPEGECIVADGEFQKYTIIPDIGYGIKQIYIDGEAAGTQNRYVFENVTGDHSISVEFELVNDVKQAVFNTAEASLSVRLINQSAGTIVVGLYDEYDNLTDMKLFTADEFTNEKTISFDKQKFANAKYCKMFMFSDIDNLKPVSKVYRKNIN